MNGRLIGWTTLAVVLAALAYGERVSAGKPDRDVLYKYSTAVGSAVAYAVILVIVLAIAGFDRDVLALRRPRSWAAALGLCLVLLVVVYVAIAALDSVLHGTKEQGLTPSEWEPRHAAAYVVNAVVVAGVAPVVEELTFRGLGFGVLERFGVWIAIAVVGIAFAAAHGLVDAFPELALFGCVLAWLRWRTASVLPGMLLHATFNTISLVAAVTVGN